MKNISNPSFEILIIAGALSGACVALCTLNPISDGEMSPATCPVSKRSLRSRIEPILYSLYERFLAQISTIIFLRSGPASPPRQPDDQAPLEVDRLQQLNCLLQG